MKLSVIIPYCNEYPQILFTVQSIMNELNVVTFDWEIVTINNYAPEVSLQNTRKISCKCGKEWHLKREEDKGGGKLQAYSKTHPGKLIAIEYKEKLSHWNAKNAGVVASTGDILLFLDAHCSIYSGTLRRMFSTYEEAMEWGDSLSKGSLHLPLLYMLDRYSRRLIYKPVCKPENGWYNYSFTRYRNEPSPYTVAAMSTCGMMISRELFIQLGGWPKELGIYGGGENFINYSLAVMGKNKTILSPSMPLIHFADRRGYSFNASDLIRNRLMATYMFGGEKLLRHFSQFSKGRPTVKEKMVEDILEKCAHHRKLIESQQVIEIEDWFYNFKSELL